MKKTDLQKDGFDPKLAKNDKLYYLDLKQGQYLPLGEEEYDKIISGQIRLWSVRNLLYFSVVIININSSKGCRVNEVICIVNGVCMLLCVQ